MVSWNTNFGVGQAPGGGSVQAHAGGPLDPITSRADSTRLSTADVYGTDSARERLQLTAQNLVHRRCIEFHLAQCRELLRLDDLAQCELHLRMAIDHEKQADAARAALAALTAGTGEKPGGMLMHPRRWMEGDYWQEGEGAY